MDLSSLRATINTAKKQEETTRELNSFLEQRSFDLHRAICVPQYRTHSHLLAFVMRYVEQLPDLLKATLAICKQTGIEQLSTPSLELAVNFSLHPVDEKSTRKGLLALMNNTYVAYRLIEELNERFTNHYQEPLLPIDISKINVIIHYLIGDELASDLDIAIHIIAEQLENEVTNIALRLPPFNPQRHHQILAEAKNWPVFKSTMPVDISLNKNNQLGTAH